MDDKRRGLLTVAIVCVVLLALVSSFLPNIFYKQPDIIVADPDATGSPDPLEQATPDAQGVVVEITPQTVQSVIALLERYESCRRTLTIEYFDDGGQSLGAASTQMWEDGGWVRASVAPASGPVENVILGEGTLWLWYEGEDAVYTGPADPMSADLAQRIPTYEDVLALDKEDILDAGYESREGVPCVYVEAKGALPGYTERYWVSETGGLLMAAETEKDGVTVYAMSSGAVVSPVEASAVDAFTLPDGTVLHTPGD